MDKNQWELTVLRTRFPSSISTELRSPPLLHSKMDLQSTLLSELGEWVNYGGVGPGNVEFWFLATASSYLRWRQIWSL